MNDKLIIFYDSNMATEDSYMYIRGIRKHIKNIKLLDINNLQNTADILEIGQSKAIYNALFIKPFNKDYKNLMMRFMGEHIHELEYNENGLSITAEAVLEELKDMELKNKTVVIINQSEEVGASLAKELIDRRATVISCNSRTHSSLIEFYVHFADVVITATGDPEFILGKYLTKYVEKIIDLSNDCNDERCTRSIPTVDVLRERLMEVEE